MARPIRLVSPCSANGAAFEPRPGGKFCGHCAEVVHDLRNLTQKQAAALFRAHGGKLCGTARRDRATGELVFRKERTTVSGAAGVVLALSLAACDDAAEAPPIVPDPITETTPIEPTVEPEPTEPVAETPIDAAPPDDVGAPIPPVPNTTRARARHRAPVNPPPPPHEEVDGGMMYDPF